LVELGKRMGWDPLPLTIKEGRVRVRELAGRRMGPALETGPIAETGPLSPPLIAARNVHYGYGSRPALQGVSLEVRPGEFVALMGRNGSGKSTLLRQMVGLLMPAEGQVTVAGRPTRDTPLGDIIRTVGYVPQDPAALLFNDTVAAELAFTRRGHGLPPAAEADARLLARLGLEDVADRDPRDLSVGQRQRVALASILVADPQVILLDEPTRGLDYEQKRALVALLTELTGEGRAVVMATHDVELVAAGADRVVLLAEGQVVVDGPAREVMSDSQVFASQINKLFRDPRYLVVDDVAVAVEP
jgi:energy-coupling factor transport system ATP-binding protein